MNISSSQESITNDEGDQDEAEPQAQQIGDGHESGAAPLSAIGPNPTKLVGIEDLNSTDPSRFPTKLHRMLTEIEESPRLASIVSWQPHGRSRLIFSFLEMFGLGES
jgi:hypothetical protein